MRRLSETAVSVCLTLLLVGTWLVEPYSVVSGSMHPTLLGPHRDYACETCGRRAVLAADLPPMDGRRAYCPHCRSAGPIESELPIVAGDSLLVDRTAFWFRGPRRGEVVAFHLPGQAAKMAVKRVVGLPGETVALADGHLTIDDRPLADLMPASGPRGLDFALPYWHRGPTKWRLAADEYFVVGDNPTVSDDSRSWTTGAGVAAQLIAGKPVIVHVPRRRLPLGDGGFHVPDLAAIRYIR